MPECDKVFCTWVVTVGFTRALHKVESDDWIPLVGRNIGESRWGSKSSSWWWVCQLADPSAWHSCGFGIQVLSCAVNKK